MPAIAPSLTAWIAAAMLSGLALRIAGARGGLWLDEAMSASFAHQAQTPARVLFAINHDNNHPLNTLWLLAVGWGAPPLAARALSIATGTLAIAAAGLFAGRRGATAGAIAAALFALSPLMATYGMEARGYAPMMLAMLLALLLVDRSMSQPDRAPPAAALALLSVFGLLAHLTFAYALAVAGSWAAIELYRADGARPAALRWIALFGPALAMTGVVLASFASAAYLSPAGFQFGSYRAFTIADYREGLTDLLAFAVGDAWPATYPALPPLALAAVAVALWRMPELGRRRSLYAIAIIGIPLAMAAARLGNAYCPRYYLVSGAALLLLAAETLAALLAARGWVRAATVALVALATLGGARMNQATLHSLRGDPAPAIAAIRSLAPDGAAVLSDQAREATVLEAAAASAGYPLDVVRERCRPARFLFSDVERLPFPADPIRCGRRYRAIAAGYAQGLSGMHWQLYEAL